MQGHEVQGKFYHYNKNQEDEIFGTGHPVFIRGARSNPGKGEITMPFVDMGLSTALIQVEDAISSNGTVQGVLQKKGDNGAVLCADVPDKCVHASVWSLVNWQKIRENETKIPNVTTNKRNREVRG